MPIISKVGRKSPKTIGVIALIYALLTLGGVTMVYPFLLTLTGAVSNEFDYHRFSCFPRYWFDGAERYVKYLAEKYDGQERFDFFKSAYQMPDGWGGFRDVGADFAETRKWFTLYGLEKDPVKWEKAKRVTKDYYVFLETRYNSRRDAENTAPLFLRWNEDGFRRFLVNRYLRQAESLRGIDVESLERTERERLALEMIGETRGDYFENVGDITLGMFARYSYSVPGWIPAVNDRNLDFIDWIRGLEPSNKIPVGNHFLWYKFLKRKGFTVEKFNTLPGVEKTERSLRYLTEARFPYSVEKLPDSLRKLRDEYVDSKFPYRLRRLPVDAKTQKDYESSMRKQFGSIEAFNKIAKTSHESWAGIKLTARVPMPKDDISSFDVPTAWYDAVVGGWMRYAETAPGKQDMMETPEAAYQRFLIERYGSLESINQAYGWNKSRIESVELPVPVADYVHYIENTGAMAFSFVTYNYAQVVRFMLLRERAFFNTFVLVTMSILATLTVNPLAAYALSRFRLRHTNQILIFLLATMAFPAEVAMIPAFLLLRDFNLLNTYWALVLPTVANGFSIFLLKGFFDSLPKELYEAASIDGASEGRMFFSITLALCKPILAVSALNAFIASYGSFMWAFLTCQDSRMWTVMVWLFDFQQRSIEYPHMVMASLALASVPTLIVFMFCQKIILRGIIIPSMK